MTAVDPELDELVMMEAIELICDEHQRVVDELLDALEAAMSYHDADHGCNGFTCEYEMLRHRLAALIAKHRKGD